MASQVQPQPYSITSLPVEKNSRFQSKLINTTAALSPDLSAANLEAKILAQTPSRVPRTTIIEVPVQPKTRRCATHIHSPLSPMDVHPNGSRMVMYQSPIEYLYARSILDYSKGTTQI